MDYQKTGRVISDRRQELALTQKQLAEKLNISDRTVSRWERGVGFPDVSLLEPLADALGLSLSELIRGERLPPARQPSPEEEREVRAAAIGLGGHLRQALRRTRRLMIALAVLLACAAAVFLLLWLNPHQVYPSVSQSVSAAQAAEVCPFSLITQEEFDLATQVLNNFASYFPPPGSVDPPALELSPSLVDARAVKIDGQNVRVAAVTVLNLMIYVDYTNSTQKDDTPDRRCILSVSYDGSVSKTSTQYQNGRAVYIVENQGNTSFILIQEHRDLLYFLHEY